MSVRIREDGTIVCAAMHPALLGDTYLHDGLHEKLSLDLKVLVSEPHETHQHDGLWWWKDSVPDDRQPDAFYEDGEAG